MSKFIIRRAKAEDGAALCAIYAPYIMDTTITFEYEVPTDAAFSDRDRRAVSLSRVGKGRRDHRLRLRAPHP